ncbi:MAG: class I SAM-dependent methyltransferase [Acidobacteria bacterium]|nr:MAG: class I SAM-dependent methyltransferase [Acidobacteriota bacterium]
MTGREAAPVLTFWERTARDWKHFGPPLRPSGPDVARFEALARGEAERRGRALSALLCGVTPEIAGMAWPADTRLTAVEQSIEMIREVWPGDRPGFRVARQGNWQAPPPEPGSYDLVIGDGCFISVGFPEGCREFGASLRRALRPDGLLVMRCFVQPETREPVERVWADLEAGRIGSFHVFKWRLSMALQPAPEAGIGLAEIWDAWSRGPLTPEQVRKNTGWPEAAIATMDLYRGREHRFHFATEAALLRALQATFRLESRHVPPYELGERCPILAFRPV